MDVGKMNAGVPTLPSINNVLQGIEHQLPPLHQLNLTEPSAGATSTSSSSAPVSVQGIASSTDVMDDDVDRTKHPSGIVPTLQYAPPSFP